MLDIDREEPSAQGGSSLILALQASAEIILCKIHCFAYTYFTRIFIIINSIFSNIFLPLIVFKLFTMCGRSNDQLYCGVSRSRSNASNF